MTRSYFFLGNWTWYELFGIAAPLAIFGYQAFSQRHKNSRYAEVAAASFIYGLFFLMFAIAITAIPSFIGLARLQPMRSLHLVYLLLFIMPVTNLYLQMFRKQPAAASVLLVGVSCFMFAVQAHTYPSSSHIQLPWAKSANPWIEGFEWIRSNTPINSVFAISPGYMDEPGEDRAGFRDYAQRSVLADRSKDGGVAALFPAIADDWLRDVRVSEALDRDLTSQRLQELSDRGVTWFVGPPRITGFACFYRNSVMAVCQLPPMPVQLAAKPSTTPRQR
jgi:hypothetical protein